MLAASSGMSSFTSALNASGWITCACGSRPTSSASFSSTCEVILLESRAVIKPRQAWALSIVHWLETVLEASRGMPIFRRAPKMNACNTCARASLRPTSSANSSSTCEVILPANRAVTKPRVACALSIVQLLAPVLAAAGGMPSLTSTPNANGWNTCA